MDAFTSAMFFMPTERRGSLAARVKVPRRWFAFLLDQGAGAMVFIDLLCNADTLMVLGTSTLAVLLYATYLPTLSANLTWTAVSFMLIFPLQSAVTEAFRRREGALTALMNFRATLTHVFLAHALWDWAGSESWYGRSEDNRPKDQGGHGVKKKPYADTPLSPQHTERVQKVLLRLVDAMEELLLVPRRGRPRQSKCACSRREREDIVEAELLGRRKVLQLLGRLPMAVEEMKAAGMPANEASRVNAWHQNLSVEFERLWGFKTYRTLTSLRAMARVTIAILPFFYAPYFLWIAGRRPDGTWNALGFATAFSGLISVLFASMLNLSHQTENPFRPDSLDTLWVREEMELCRAALRETVDGMALKAKWWEDLDFEWETAAAGARAEPGDIKTTHQEA